MYVLSGQVWLSSSMMIITIARRVAVCICTHYIELRRFLKKNYSRSKAMETNNENEGLERLEYQHANI